MREGRLRNMLPFGRECKTAALSDSSEIAKLVKFHDVSWCVPDLYCTNTGALLPRSNETKSLWRLFDSSIDDSRVTPVNCVRRADCRLLRGNSLDTSRKSADYCQR